MKNVIMILVVLLLACTSAFGALTKTSTFTAGDHWQSLAAATAKDGNSIDVSGSYATTVNVEVALTGAGAHTGVTIAFETSITGSDDWTPWGGDITLGNGTTPLFDELDGAVTDANTVIDLDDAATDSFDDPFEKWFILDAVDVTHSEIMQTKSAATDALTVMQGPKYSHADASVVSNGVFQTQRALPITCSYYRVNVYNTDSADAVHWRSFPVMVTDL